MAIDFIKIFPSIGIARLGNSLDAELQHQDSPNPGEFFVGPEIPGDYTPPSGGYKDTKLRIKRQAARFYLFGYEKGSADVDAGREITLIDADIKWIVDLANTKADWHQFGGIEQTNLPLRNASITGANRASLRVSPGARTLDSTDPPDKRFKHPTKHFSTGTFRGVNVPLGEMQTDEAGHLLVLGGFGNSSSPHNTPLSNFANNDDWYDDVSDGPVNAMVRLKGTNKWIQASSAWVICGPPKFAPQIEDIITLYDSLLQAAVDKGLLGASELVPADPPSFTNDIYPLLARAMNMGWVSALAQAMHPKIRNSMPHPGPDTLDQKNARMDVFKRLRNPNNDPRTTVFRQDMPKIWSDLYPVRVGASLTKIQYHVLEQWKEGEFDNDWMGTAPTEAASTTRITPRGLTCTALENCVGGNFYPGIETSFMTRDSYAFVEPFEFRLDATQLKPGDLTKQMAIPWQADFLACAYNDGLQWWPAHRPDDVFPAGGTFQVPWIRQEDNIRTREDFVRSWHKFGFVIQQGDQYIESQRNA